MHCVKHLACFVVAFSLYLKSTHSEPPRYSGIHELDSLASQLIAEVSVSALMHSHLFPMIEH